MQPKTKAVPSGRLSRIMHLGSLVTRVAGGVVAESVRQYSSGHRPSPKDVLLTPANLKRVAEKLAHLRGAAMKVGQLLSMDAGDLLPAELSELLSQLRASATPMPMLQLAEVLEQSFGNDWQASFQQFGFTPIAAASIGQVHRAVLLNGQVVALKIQYPGVAKSIDSDVDNVVSLLKLSRLLPAGLDLTELIEEAKVQLHAEADYQQEASHLRYYRDSLVGNPQIRVPEYIPELSTQHVLAMSYEQGEPLESVETLSHGIRQQVAEALLSLFFQELFEFRRVQTDPNFANYLYDASTSQLVLLDFGATRVYSKTICDAYRALFTAGVQGDSQLMEQAARQIGYFSESVNEGQVASVMRLFSLALEPLKADHAYDFSSTDLARRLRDQGMELSFGQGYWHSPPVDALFLHRKLAGLYLLFARLKVKINCQGVLRPWLTHDEQ
ncbi:MULTISPECIES: ABC1 kinase family protein [Nitrincola]|uniref:Putative ubiquinone biosynthesis protein UbiB n=1 Tax=Nitrincola nitratireducens TaxID=1229521 RepID=W9UT33_9GAMM|nr:MULTISPECIES: AarF/ABC1/UbiB kinase family protein [Nitrincola]EXJ10378.1 putative ubiquinone biosynthesis protein UbiB [Nitrincola nitratireducens]